MSYTKNSELNRKWRRFLTGYVIALALVSACTVRLIAPYDEITDRKIYELQEDVALTFKQWERNLPEFEEVAPFYDQVEITLQMLIERNQSVEKSQQIVSMLKYLQENFNLIRQQHTGNNLTEEFISEIYPDLNAQFNAVQRFQMALKKAEKTTK